MKNQRGGAPPLVLRSLPNEPMVPAVRLIMNVQPFCASLGKQSIIVRGGGGNGQILEFEFLFFVFLENL